MLHRGFSTVGAWFWDERIWFPPGHNWTSIHSTPETPYPVFDDMYRAIKWGFGLMLFRAIFEWIIARPLGRYYGVSDRVVAPSLWGRIKAFMAGLGLEPHQTNKLTNGVANGSPSKSRRPSAKVTTHSKLDKFAECCWRFSAYSFLWLYGIAIMVRKPWFWDTTHCYIGYPLHPLDADVWWYYMMEAAFYWSLMFSQAFDGQYRRSDFAMNLVHHLATIALLWLSWADNFVRVGTLVLVIHDLVDPIIEAFKMIRYANRSFSSIDNKAGNAMFAAFLVSWFITRCGLFPFKIIYSTLFVAPQHIIFYPVYYIFNGFLLLLQCLHLIWSYMILGMAIKAMRQGETEDVRSDDESDDDAPAKKQH